MEMTRISVPVTVEERERIREMARQELRTPRDHARYLLRQALGLADGQPPVPMADRGATELEAQRAAA